jgi:hypothetical protein
MSLRERSKEKNTGVIAAFLAAITVLGIGGLGIMLGGTFTLTEAHLKEDMVGFFMLFTFLIVAVTEILLVRQLSRVIAAPRLKDTPQHFVTPAEFRPAEPRVLAEPLASVTENTTRTLEYSRNESVR